MTRLLTFIAMFAAVLLAAPSGQYAGTWASDGGANSGKVDITLNESGSGDVAFTYQGQIFRAKKLSAKLDGEKIEFIFELELEGFKLKTIYTGTIDGKNMSGKYHTSNADDGSDLDSGIWKVTQQ